ncbi:MAG: hypothetical protein ABIU95_09395 [Burkholderiales bacterium]
MTREAFLSAAKLARGRRIVELAVPTRCPTVPVKRYWHARVHRDAGNAWLRELIVDLFHRTDRLD